MAQKKKVLLAKDPPGSKNNNFDIAMAQGIFQWQILLLSQRIGTFSIPAVYAAQR